MAGKKKITQAQLKVILEQHKKWVDDDPEGKRADLSGANLAKANLSGADLRGANLTGANLTKANLAKANLSGAELYCAKLPDADLSEAVMRKATLHNAVMPKADMSGANLHGADLWHADLSEANLYEANLSSADLRDTDLRGADLCCAYLRGTNLHGAELCDVDLSGANLVGAKLSGARGLSTVKCDIFTAGFRLTPPETGEYVAWKSAGKNIIKLLIPASAERSSATTHICRASEAKVLGIYTLKGKLTKITTVYSDHDKSFAYNVGETVSVPDFNPDRWVDYTTGIHHFMTMAEAIDWAD